MTPRQVIFISAVSRELKGARQLVANTLQFLGYEPVWQDIFGTEQGDLRAMLRRQIDGCKGLVQLVGHRYGAEPPSPDEQFGRVSYTQYEALYARQRGKKVWYLFLDEDFPGDTHEVEPEELRELQASYRRRLQSESHLYHPLSSREALETSVLKLRDDLARLRRGVKQWAFGVAALLMVLTAVVLWLVHGQQKQTKIIQKQSEQVNTLVNGNQKIQQALEKLADVESRGRQPGEILSPQEQRARAYAVLEKGLGLERGTLAKELPAFALELYHRSDTTPLMRAKAAYALNKFDEAEKLSAEAAEQDRQAYENAKQVAEDRRTQAIADFVMAGESAERRIQYAAALNYLREAEKLTDRQRNPREWADVQRAVGFALYHLGNFKEAVLAAREELNERLRWSGAEIAETLGCRENLAAALAAEGRYAEAEKEQREVLATHERILGADHLDTLLSRNNLAATLADAGQLAEAEKESRAVLAARERLQGPEHPDTLISRHILGCVLQREGRHAEAEKEQRQVLTVRTRLLGPEHPDTLRSRNDMAAMLDHSGRYAEAEKEYRAVLTIQERVLSPEHPDTLITRNNLACVLAKEGNYLEAEGEDRRVLAIQERVLGPEHPDTLMTRNNLATVLDNSGRYAEAEKECRAALTIQERVLGPEHPDTLTARNNLACVLAKEGNYSEAEGEDRRVLAIQERVLGPEHPSTLTTRNNLATVLDDSDRFAEAEKEHRAVLAIRERVLGPEHSDTLKGRNNLATVLDHSRRYAEAEKECRAVLAIQERVFGPEHPDTLTTRNNLADILDDEGNYTEAEREDRTVLAVRERILGPEHPDTLNNRQHLASVLFSEGKHPELEQELRAVLAAQVHLHGAEAPETFSWRQRLAYTLYCQGKYADAVTNQQKALAVARKGSGDEARRQTVEAWFVLSRYELFARDFTGVMAATEAGLALDRTYLPLLAKRAHACLFLGQTREAEQIYQGHRGETMDANSKRTWEQVILKDFDDLEKAGLTNRELPRIRELLKTEVR